MVCLLLDHLNQSESDSKNLILSRSSLLISISKAFGIFCAHLHAAHLDPMHIFDTHLFADSCRQSVFQHLLFNASFSVSSIYRHLPLALMMAGRAQDRTHLFQL